VVYGGLKGVVEHIGADTVMDEEGNPFYEVTVRTNEPQLASDKPIIPGMVVEVDILTGKKSVLAYLMKPILRAKQYALTER
jgi:adhesin transport system membrane fusion protein